MRKYGVKSVFRRQYDDGKPVVGDALNDVQELVQIEPGNDGHNRAETYKQAANRLQDFHVGNPHVVLVFIRTRGFQFVCLRLGEFSDAVSVA